MNSIWLSTILVLAGALLTRGGGVQGLAPVDISEFGKDHPLQAAFTQISISECKGAGYIKSGKSGYDNLSYDLHLSGDLVFKNRSGKTVILYKNFDPASTERVATSEADLTSGTYVTGYDRDRMAIGKEPKKVSIADFVVLKPGEDYTSKAQATVYASTNPHKPLHAPGRYWVQLGIDARPDEFYLDASAETQFKYKWQTRGQVVDFILSEPFSMEIALDPNAPTCKQ